MTAFLEIFDVEHGSCALVTAETGARMLIDCGRNMSTGWTPAIPLKARSVDELEVLAVTNYDEDHVDGLPELRKAVGIRTLLRSKNVNPDEIVQLKSEDGMGNGIAELVKMAGTYTAPADPIDFGNITRKVFYNSKNDFDDENNLSMLLILSFGAQKVVFCGDMERAGFDRILQRSEVRDAVAAASILIAPHHGRESSVHEGFLKLVNPFWTVISDKGYQYATQETVPTYRKHCRGGAFRGETRHVLTTRKDGTITFYFNQQGWGAE